MILISDNDGLIAENSDLIADKGGLIAAHLNLIAIKNFLIPGLRFGPHLNLPNLNLNLGIKTILIAIKKILIFGILIFRPARGS